MYYAWAYRSTWVPVPFEQENRQKRMRREPQRAGENRRYLQHADKFMELADVALPELAGLLRPPHGVLHILLFHLF